MLVALLVAAQINVQVQQSNVDKTVCRPGWSTAYRKAHPLHVPAKRGYVRDHKVSIELGGTSSNANIQYQTIVDGHEKDLEEDRLHKLVCSHKMPLATAQKQIDAWKP